MNLLCFSSISYQKLLCTWPISCTCCPRSGIFPPGAGTSSLASQCRAGPDKPHGTGPQPHCLFQHQDNFAPPQTHWVRRPGTQGAGSACRKREVLGKHMQGRPNPPGRPPCWLLTMHPDGPSPHACSRLFTGIETSFLTLKVSAQLTVNSY